MFAVMGATGKVGGAVADELLRQGKEVRAVVRSADKARALQDRGAEIALAEYEDEDALAAAFHGTEGAFVMIPPNMTPAHGFPDSMRQVACLYDALKVSKPQRYVALSTIGAEQTNFTGLLMPLHNMEEVLGRLHIRAVFLRAGSFMENYLWEIPAARKTGELQSFMAPLDKQFPMVATHDIGAIAARMLIEDWKYTRYVEVSGPRTYSPNDIAAAMTDVLGREVRAVEVPRDQWQNVMVERGMPPDRTGPYTDMLDGINSGWISFGQAGTEHVHGTTEFRSVLEQMVADQAG